MTLPDCGNVASSDAQPRERESATFAEIRKMIGEAPRTSDWVTVDQSRIDGFAEHTGDDAFIHVDPGRARHTRFGGTIAHGLLSLSLLPYLLRSAMPYPSESRLGVNYGFDRVRFLTPVPVGGRVRAHVAISGVTEDKPGFVIITYDAEVELEGHEKPALSARWLIGHWVMR